ncbi:tail fiber domain-containing protein [bacterium]|nr:tail fiber domain-containing protein [bacterium]
MTRIATLTASHLTASAVALVLFGTVVAYAWTGPTGTAPNSNVAAPINTSATAQVKNGALSVSTLTNYGAIMQQMNASYDVWVQGGSTTASGDARNLALLGVISTDRIYLNYNGEYAGGTYLGGNVYAAGYFHTSDASLKKDVRPIKGLDIVKKLSGVLFTWKESGKASAGVIAQDVEKVLPEAVITDGDGIKSVDYDALIAPLIEAVKEQQSEIDGLKAEIEALKAAR